MVAHRKMSRLDAELAAEMIANGETVRSVCKRFNITPPALYRTFDRVGIDREGQRAPLTADEKFYINQEFLNGSTVQQICVKWGIKKSTAYNALAATRVELKKARKDNAHDDDVEQRPADRARRDHAVRRSSPE